MRRYALLYPYFDILVLPLIIIFKINYFIKSLLLTVILKHLLSLTVMFKTSFVYLFYFPNFTFKNYFNN